MKKAVEVTFVVEVEYDESKFTPEFMAEFRKDFYNFQTVDRHIEHIASLEARGLIGGDRFVEGYGDIDEFIARAEVVDTTFEVYDA